MKIIVVLSFVACAAAINVKQCDSDNPIDDLNNRIQIDNCNKRGCRVKKDSFLKVSMKFTPAENIKGLKNHVTADILGAKLPFVGVDGEDACSHVFDKDGKKLPNCDLKAGQDYFYNDSFEILKIYPSIQTTVHWALVSPDNKNVLCFEVPVTIAS
ncbi:unnamed protein product [Phyllotreta striolata]|uniref:MD-2-related lipid-recognition domain-containing protein n=1 Tax=Phyllotreta striolata TaxID=444603 RepID=A0A9N9TUV9_PHYSR|nr:unnamed protein product [Phyllotreta striolata]